MILLLLFMNAILAMEDVVVHNTPTPHDEELSRIVIAFYFRQCDERIKREILPAVTHRINLTRSSPEKQHERVLAKLEDIYTTFQGPEARGVEIDPSGIHRNQSEIHSFFARLINDSLKDVLDKKEEEHKVALEKAKKKERQKRIAIAAGIFSTFVTGAVSLITHFVS